MTNDNSKAISLTSDIAPTEGKTAALNCGMDECLTQTVDTEFSKLLLSVNELDEKKGKNIESFVNLIGELKKIKNISLEQIQDFMCEVKHRIEDQWILFLTKVAMELNPQKFGFDEKMSGFIITEVEMLLHNNNIPIDSISDVMEQFRETSNAAGIAEFLRHSLDYSKQETSEQKPNTKQELACILFIWFYLACQCFWGRGAYKQQLIIDRAFAETLSEWSGKKMAGVTLGKILSAKVYSPKRVSELTYLYTGVFDAIDKKNRRILDLEQRCTILNDERNSLRQEIEEWNKSNHGLIDQIAQLTAEKAKLEDERVAADNMLEYERNKYQRQLDTKESGIAEQFLNDIGLELQAIYDLTEYLQEDDQRRIRRRLDRISNILQKSEDV